MLTSYDPLKGKILQMLDESGRLVKGKHQPLLEGEALVAAYRHMLRARVADEKALQFQRQKRIHTLPVNKGQEAAAVGSALALAADDWMVQSYRELGALLVKGATIRNHLLYFKGSEWGAVHPGHPRILPLSVPIGSQITHAAGIGHAIRYQGGREVVIVYFGDGGTSQGDFHEGLNWAALFGCPVIFFCNNNQYAISLNRRRQTLTPTLAQKAVAYGMPGLQVDGNDLLAVHAATAAAADHARTGKGPVLIEALTYRMGPHTTADDPSLYRSREEELQWEARDPLVRVRRLLESRGQWDDAREEACRQEAVAETDAAMREVDELHETPVDEVFAFQYADRPAELVRQQAAFEAYLSWKEAR
ncbi:MAG: pyruvate dehydrogenase (acetyl-transferring) E1 component subunit alpha [bacterium]|nr:pyruvate dehydrogenase (acetyl-transferring) E1 component subunit alpha [bacterium]